MPNLTRCRFWIILIAFSAVSLIVQIAIPNRVPAAFPDDHQSFLLVRHPDGQLIAMNMTESGPAAVDGQIAAVATVWWKTDPFRFWDTDQFIRLSRINPPIGTLLKVEVTWSNYFESYDDIGPIISSISASSSIDVLPSVVQSSLLSVSQSFNLTTFVRMPCNSCIVIGFFRALMTIVSLIGLVVGLAGLTRAWIVVGMREKSFKCRSCGYHIEGIQAACPECGHVTVVRKAASERRVGLKS